MMADDTKTEDADDPADYLFKTSEFHDCTLTVGDPSTNEMEKIPVVRSQLVAHSSVFRDMLKDSDLADPTGAKTHIKDVRPEIFKLMLRHMYGGELQELKTLEKEKLSELALCADKYNVGRLVEKTCENLIPKDVNSVFIPLFLVAHIQSPTLAQLTVELIQKETKQVVEHEEFLNIDENCVELIAKQEKLSIKEVDLWKAVLKWGKSQAEQRDLPLLDVLKKPLAYIRFANFSLEEIVKEVVPEGIFSSGETLQLLTLVTNKQEIDIPGLCKTQKIRDVLLPSDWDVDNDGRGVQTWSPDGSSRSRSTSDVSAFSIKNVSNYDIAIVSIDTEANNDLWGYYSYDDSWGYYSYACNVTLFKSNDGYLQHFSYYLNAPGDIGSSAVDNMPLKSSTGKYCILKPNESCIVVMNFTSAYPFYSNRCTKSDGYISVASKNSHARSIKYKVKK